MPVVYILRCSDGTLYSGAAKDLNRRLRQHQEGKASSYTAVRRPVDLVWFREVEDWGAALREEHRLKKLDRAGKLALIGLAAT